MPDRIADEKRVVALMIRMYCRRHCRQQGRTAKTELADRTGARHSTSPLCPECAALLDYAVRRLDSCRFGNGKPSCRKCQVHCYRADMRERIRKVMRWAGPRMIFHHPLAATRHLLRELRSPEPPK